MHRSCGILFVLLGYSLEIKDKMGSVLNTCMHLIKVQASLWLICNLLTNCSLIKNLQVILSHSINILISFLRCVKNKLAENLVLHYKNTCQSVNVPLIVNHTLLTTREIPRLV